MTLNFSMDAAFTVSHEGKIWVVFSGHKDGHMFGVSVAFGAGNATHLPTDTIKLMISELYEKMPNDLLTPELIKFMYERDKYDDLIDRTSTSEGITDLRSIVKRAIEYYVLLPVVMITSRCDKPLVSKADFLEFQQKLIDDNVDNLISPDVMKRLIALLTKRL